MYEKFVLGAWAPETLGAAERRPDVVFKKPEVARALNIDATQYLANVPHTHLLSVAGYQRLSTHPSPMVCAFMEEA